jgi:hypothetical protein
MEMNMINKYRVRFEELEVQLVRLENTKYKSKNNAEFVDNELLNEWRVKVKNLIVNACGRESEHYKDLIESEKTRNLDTNY